jgi:hypothetical protein
MSVDTENSLYCVTVLYEGAYKVCCIGGYQSVLMHEVTPLDVSL